MVIERVEVEATFTQKGLAAFKKNINGWNAAMAAPLGRMKELQDGTNGWDKSQMEANSTMGRAALGIRKATHGMRGFRMEMLGLMFFGMAMARMFGGLMKTAVEWSGLMDLLSMTLGVVFLPVILQITEALIPIFSWFMNLSDSTKLWIGWIVVLGFVIGTALMVIGMMALGIGSLIQVFGAFSIATMIGSFIGLGVVLIGIIGIILMLKGAFGGFDKEFDDSLSKWQQNGGMFAKTMGAIVRTFILGGAIIGATFKNLGGMFLIIINTMAKGLTIAVVWIINKFIDLWNWIKKVASAGFGYTATANVVADTSAFDAIVKNQMEGIADRSVDLLLNTPTLGNLLTGGPAVPETQVDNRTNAEKRGEVATTNITNNYNGFSNEDLLKELDSRDREMVSQMERNR